MLCRRASPCDTGDGSGTGYSIWAYDENLNLRWRQDAHGAWYGMYIWFYDVDGDGDNDIGMFELAPRAIAPANATKRLRTLATDVIGPNSEDDVVRYLSAQMQ